MAASLLRVPHEFGLIIKENMGWPVNNNLRGIAGLASGPDGACRGPKTE